MRVDCLYLAAFVGMLSKIVSRYILKLWTVSGSCVSIFSKMSCICCSKVCVTTIFICSIFLLAITRILADTSEDLLCLSFHRFGTSQALFLFVLSEYSALAHHSSSSSFSSALQPIFSQVASPIERIASLMIPTFSSSSAISRSSSFSI